MTKQYTKSNQQIVYLSRKPYILNYPYPSEMVDSRRYRIPVHHGGIDRYAYNNYVHDSLSTPNSAETSKSIEKPRVNLVLKIETISDLIELGEKYGVEYATDVDYNINLKMIHDLVEPMKEINAMIGQHGLKKQIVELILYYSQELNVKNDDLLHTIIDGEPGTGKTEFAHLIAKVYLKMGVLKHDVFKKVKRSDLIAGFLGQTALKTQKILEEVRGGVLFIDEAYSLGNSEGKDSKDIYSKECIDLLNQSLTEMREEDDNYFICMIAGYKEDLKNSFFSYNDGLERRFSIHFRMDEYTDQDLVDIFKKKVRQNKWEIDQDAISAEFINKNRQYFKFHGGDMELLFAKCKISHSKNIISTADRVKKVLNNKDVVDGFEIFKQNKRNLEITNETGNWKNLYN
jgi:Holliday junction resolvasome RuvABC ATP-dependent DNA helicase subunit